MSVIDDVRQFETAMLQKLFSGDSRFRLSTEFSSDMSAIFARIKNVI